MTEMERILRECADPKELDAVIRHLYGGSMKRFLSSNDLDRSPEEVEEELDGESLCQWLSQMVSEQFRDVEELLEKEAEQQEFWERQDRLYDIYHRVIEPLRDRAVAYARRHPSIYSVKENVDSTYIRGEGGTIRFSDHPPKVDYYDTEGRPVFRGGWDKSSTFAGGGFHDAADFHADPVNTPDLTWETVHDWLRRIVA